MFRIIKALFIICFIFISCRSSDITGSEVRNQEIYDVIVIGAGGGGLAAASTLARAGKRILLIEQRPVVGGYMSSFKRGDYNFEVSHMAMESLDSGHHTRDLMIELGIMDRLSYVRLDPMYRIIFPDSIVDIPADPDKYKEMLEKQYPREADGIDDFFDDLESIYTFASIVFPMKRGDYPGYIWSALTHPVSFWPLLKYINSTFPEVIMDYNIKDPKLLMTMCMYAFGMGGDIINMSGVVAMGFLSVLHYGGYNYVLGGGTAISKALEDNIRDSGGEILLSTRVDKILIENGRAAGVRTSDGREYKSRYIVSNANGPDTFFKLVGREHLPEDYVKKLETLKIGNSVFLVYLGVNRDYRKYFPDGTGQLFIVDETSDLIKLGMYFIEGIPEKIPYVLFNNSCVDPGLAPEGKNVLHIMTALPYDWNNGWKEKEDYKKYTDLKNNVGRILIKRLEKYLPDLSRHVEVMEVATPRTMEHFTSNPGGSIFGWDNTVNQSHIYRLPQNTPIDNLYLAGAWTYPGGGQSTVLRSGLLAAKLILERD